MSLMQTTSANRTHIAIFGVRNAGKSSLVNAVLGQDLSVVSPLKGTTTDPVSKAMELLPLGPVMIIDTPGFDDEGMLGELRIRKTKQVLNRTDIAVLVVDAAQGFTATDYELLDLFKEKDIPYLVALNKADLGTFRAGENMYLVSAKTGQGIHEFKEALAKFVPCDESTVFPEQLLAPGDTVLLIIPIDSGAPKGRLILPQQQALRELLDRRCIALAVQDPDVPAVLANLKTPPKLAVTDSQVFHLVDKTVPESVMLTSFSVLFAHKSGLLKEAVRSAKAVERLKDGDTVLMAESCTHHRQCDDIGRVKLPRLLREHTGKELNFEYSSGKDFPEDLSRYDLVVHCGGCMTPGRELRARMKSATDAGVPITNYGILIAYLRGILPRCVAMFPDIARELGT